MRAPHPPRLVVFRPLDGMRVVDMTRLLPGPFLGQLLGDLGADVIKIEELGGGDYTRTLEPATFDAINRGKRSLALNLKAPGAREIVLRLAARADVLLESFRPGVMDRLGLSDDALSNANPRLIRASLVGYPTGERRDEVGHDLNYESLAGILAIQGGASRPVPSAVPLADMTGALYAAVGILAALHERARTGRGARVEVALADAAWAVNGANLALAATAGGAPPRGAWPLAGGLPNYDLYRCRDGGWIALGALETKFWERFATASGLPDDATRADVEAKFATRGRDEWARVLRDAGVPATPVLEPHEVLAARGLPSPGSPLTGEGLKGRAPEVGGESEALLQELGLSAADVARLRAHGAI